MSTAPSPAPSADTAPREWCNGSRFDPQSKKGFYESWFARANHPTKPQAFWIRYTVFSPKGRPEEAACELWAIWFDRDAERVVAAKEIVPMADCSLAGTGLDVTMGGCTLGPAALKGAASHGGVELAWDLSFTSPTDPILDFPRGMYGGGFPKAKALVGSPGAVYRGTLEVAGETIPIDGWIGSHNHNWGSQHTNRYGWAQIAGFDDEPDSFLECGAGKLKIGPIWTPWLGVIVLRTGGQEYRLNGIGQWLKNKGRCDGLRLTFDAKQGGLRLHGSVEADRSDFVGLPYWDPPGGIRTCLNSKLARADFTLERPGEPPKRLICERRAALEFLVDGTGHGIDVLDMPSPLRGG